MKPFAEFCAHYQVALAITNHIETALLEHKGREQGRQACREFLGDMLPSDMADLSPLGVTVMDELFTSLVNDVERTGLSGLPATH